MTQKSTRKLKIQPVYRTANTHIGLKIVPNLKLSGVRLEQSGFKAGHRVTITAMYEELIIKTLKP